MDEFFNKLRELFKKIPSKAKFLKDLGFKNSYIGFRYFLQGHKDQPSDSLMEKISDRLGYEYVYIPIKNTKKNQLMLDNMLSEFYDDLELYLKNYEEGNEDKIPQNNTENPSIDKELSVFEMEQPKDKKTIDNLDIEDLF
jgi:hypothetical protein